MQLKIDKTLYDAEWCKFGDIELNIRPYPMSRADVTIKQGGFVVSGSGNFDRFDYCLVGHKGLTDADGKTLELTQDVKKLIYDFRLGRTYVEEMDATMSISEFVLYKSRQKSGEIETETKN